VEPVRSDILRAIWRPLPKNGADDLLLVCPYCDIPRRYLYGWEAAGTFTNSAESSRWLCRSFARLYYSSEGGRLRPSVMFRAFGNYPRPQSWLPYVFTDIDQAIEVIG
jgi:hypothetical protein